MENLTATQSNEGLIHLLLRHMLQWLHVISDFLLESRAWSGPLLPWETSIGTLRKGMMSWTHGAVCVAVL